MTENLVYIDDELIDLPPSTLITYTFQNTIPGKLANRYASYTNTFKAPFSEVNDRIFTFKRNIKAKQEFVTQNVKWVQNGIEIISSGMIVCNKTQSHYEVQILDGIVSFIALLGDEKIDDLYVIDTNLITWNAATIDAKRATSTGLISPVVSYGQMLANFGLTNDDFSSGLFGWEQLNLINQSSQFPSLQNKTWSSSSGMAVAQTETFFDATAGTHNGYTKVIRQPYYFYLGQDYTITIDGRYLSGGPAQPSDVYIRLYLQDGITFEDFLVGTFTTSYADYVLNLTADQDYFYFGFYTIMTYNGPTANTISDVEIRDVSIEITLRIGDVYLPSVWYADIINRIIQEHGYNADGEIFSNDIYSRLIIPFCKDELKYTGLFNDCREFKARLSAPQTISVDGNIIFDEILKKDLYGYYDPTDGNYSQNNDYEFEIDPAPDTRSFFSRFNVSLVVQVISGSVTIQILSQGDGVLNQVVLSSVGRYTVNLSANKFGTSSEGYNMSGGDTVSVYCDLTGGSINVLSGEFSNLVNGINQDDTPIFFTCEILPELNKVDLFSDFFIRFGLIPKDKNKTLTVKTFEEVIRDKANAVDWTDKRSYSDKDPIEYDLNYTQNNYFVYPSSDDFFKADRTRGNIICENTTLDVEQTIYDSLFVGSADISVGDDTNYVYAGYIPIWLTPPVGYPTVLGGTAFDNSPELRLMVTRDKESGEANVEFDGNSRSDYLVANFVLPGEKYLSWEAFLDDHYPSLREAIRQNKSITREYALTEEDIQKLDPHTLVYDEGDYFLISRISKFIPGEITKVELFKVY